MDFQNHINRKIYLKHHYEPCFLPLWHFHAQSNKIINQKIKFRDSFRPFCPSVLEEDSEKFFVGKKRISPHMTINYDVDESAIKKIPSVVHVDQTARIQTVNKNQNEMYYKFLSYLKEIIGVGVCLNTSFNVNNEPIVNTPREAIATFFGSGMDCLVIGNYILEK